MTFFLQQSLNGVMLGVVFALFALGFGLVLANMHVFHVAHEAVFAWSAVVFWTCLEKFDLPVVVAFVAAILSASVLNLALYLLLIRRILGRPNRELAGFMSSLGGLIILVELADRYLGEQTVSVPSDAFPRAVWSLGSVRFTSVQLLVVLATAACFALMYWLVERSSMGRQIRTVAYDRQLAGIVGVDAERVTRTVFLVSGALAGVAGSLIALLFNVVNAGIGAAYLVTGIAVMVLGGYGSVVGTILAGLAIGLVYSLTGGYLSSSYKEVVVYALLLAFLAVRPTGFFRARIAELRA